MNYGFVRAAAAVPCLKVADCRYNAQEIIEIIKKANSLEIQFIVFPELCITAYTCGDLFHQQVLLKEAVQQLQTILYKTKDINIVSIIGLPLVADNQLFNCAVVIQSGRILGAIPKSYIPCYKEYYEERWFAEASKVLSDTILLCNQQVPFGTDILFSDDANQGVCFGVEVCEDLWVPIPPSSHQALSGAVILFNLSASNEIIGKYEYRRQLVGQQSARCMAGYVYSSCGINESTTDVVFGGHALIAENGEILCESGRFKEESQLIYTEIDVEKLINDRLKNNTFMETTSGIAFRKAAFKIKETKIKSVRRQISAHPFVPSDMGVRDDRCSEIFAIQTSGLGKRMRHIGMRHAVVGISGGLDSTLALLVTAKTFDNLGISRENIIAITMPGFGTTNNTYDNAVQLMKSMQVTIMEIDIKNSCMQHFKDIQHDADIHDVTYENVQARERTQILMDIANKHDGLVIGTGDLSELALGWCTYNGDHMSMYSVNCGVPKTLVKYLVKWVSDNVIDHKAKDVLNNILNTPITPELLPPDPNGEIKQKTEDIIGPYELHDFFLYHIVRYGACPQKVLFLAQQAFKGEYSREVIKKWLKVFYKRFFSQQFKRSCLPDGPKVGTISLSPRGDWRMASDAQAVIWLESLEKL